MFLSLSFNLNVTNRGANILTAAGLVLCLICCSGFVQHVVTILKEGPLRNRRHQPAMGGGGGDKLNLTVCASVGTSTTIQSQEILQKSYSSPNH
jgi:hypothetical protein